MSVGALIADIGLQAGEGLYNWFQTKHKEQREDNAVTRRVADMKNAGLNPILAAGNPAQASQATPASIDTNLPANLLAGQELKNLKLQGKGLENANNISNQQLNDLKQEYSERMRNINFYKNLGIPSDRPNSWVTDLEQIVQMIKSPNSNSSLGATVDNAKTFLGEQVGKLQNAGETIKETAKSAVKTGEKAVDSYIWFLQHTPIGLAVKGTQGAWKAFQDWRKRTFGGKND